MPRRMARGRGGRSGGKTRYSWHGFYMNAALEPSDVLADAFILYDAIDADHQEEVVLERTIIHFQCSNTATGGSGRIGFGLYLVELDQARNLSSDVDPLGTTAFDIEANWQLWHKIVDLPVATTGQNVQQFEYDFNSKAKRKIEDPKSLIMLVRGTTVDRWRYMFQARCLVKEGRF